MIWRGKKLSDLSEAEFLEAVDQNNRFGDVACRPDAARDIREAWHGKALALAAEGERRGLGGQDDYAEARA